MAEGTATKLADQHHAKHALQWPLSYALSCFVNFKKVGGISAVLSTVAIDAAILVQPQYVV